LQIASSKVDAVRPNRRQVPLGTINRLSLWYGTVEVHDYAHFHWRKIERTSPDPPALASSLRARELPRESERVELSTVRQFEALHELILVHVRPSMIAPRQLLQPL
jgi:hypothetical protein